jgi:hypothetical protein
MVIFLNFLPSPILGEGPGVGEPICGKQHHLAHKSCGIRHLTTCLTLIKVKLHKFHATWISLRES